MSATIERVTTVASEPLAGRDGLQTAEKADPITTEVIRHALNSAAGQMKWVLIRAAFAPNIYEVRDFAVAIYDREIRLLAQAPSLPLFMGTMSFCIEGAVEGVGGEENLEPGDIILYNWPYGIGSHAQDAALVMPVFASSDELVGYATIKAHWPDIGAQAPYCTDTTDVFQEGTFFPGVKLFRRGERNDEIYRIMLANSRMPRILAGDVGAQTMGVRTGATALSRLVDRYSIEIFQACVERMFEHGETLARKAFASIPDGRYVGAGQMDDNGVDHDPIPFEVAVEIDGSTVRVDYSDAPDAQRGPINCPLATTVSVTRLAMSLLAEGSGAPNEGIYRPVEIITRPGSLFHPVSPDPCFLYAWPAAHAVDVIYRAIAQAAPERVPACSGGHVHGLVSWGIDPATGEPVVRRPAASQWPRRIHRRRRGELSPAFRAWCRAPSTRGDLRNKNPIFDRKGGVSAGTPVGRGSTAGGLGFDKIFESRDDNTYATPVVEGTKATAWGLAGGGEGRTNTATIHLPDGSVIPAAKGTGLHLPKGARFVMETGGGGGFGPAAERDPAAVIDDLENGYITEEFARRYYPEALNVCCEGKRQDLNTQFARKTDLTGVKIGYRSKKENRFV